MVLWRLIGLATVGVVACALPVGTATAAIPALYKNCTASSTSIRHKVGKVGARDKTKSGDPVTTFKRSNRIHKLAIHYNSALDRNKDGVACEKK